MDNNELLDIILNNQNEGKISVMTIDGLCTTNVNDIVNQPVEGLLYDLNRDKASLMSLAHESKNKRWVNDLAMAFVVEHLYNQNATFNAQLDKNRIELMGWEDKYNAVVAELNELKTKFVELEQSHKELKESNFVLNTYVAELEEYIDKLNVKPVEEKVTTEVTTDIIAITPQPKIDSTAKRTSIFQPVMGSITI